MNKVSAENINDIKKILKKNEKKMDYTKIVKYREEYLKNHKNEKK